MAVAGTHSQMEARDRRRCVGGHKLRLVSLPAPDHQFVSVQDDAQSVGHITKCGKARLRSWAQRPCVQRCGDGVIARSAFHGQHAANHVVCMMPVWSEEQLTVFRLFDLDYWLVLLWPLPFGSQGRCFEVIEESVRRRNGGEPLSFLCRHQGVGAGSAASIDRSPIVGTPLDLIQHTVSSYVVKSFCIISII